jgi:hypothetical protein
MVVAAVCSGALAAAALSTPGDAAPATKPTTATVAADTQAALAARVDDAATRASRSQGRATPVDAATPTPTASSKARIEAAKPASPATALKVPAPTKTKAATPAPKKSTATQPASPKATSAPAAAAAAAPAPAAAPKTLPAISGLTAVQVSNAEVIVAVGKSMGVSARGQIIAVATSLQESQLYNLDVAVDHDSLGLFQQRPSSGWGTVAQLTDPAYAARAFYQVLIQYTGDWGCLTCAAQRVQVSAYPDAYAKHETLATQIVTALENY